MNKLRGNQAGFNLLIVPVVLLSLFFIAAAVFGFMAFSSGQDYKNNSDKKVAQAVAANKKTIQAEDARQYAEAAKNPLKLYVGPDEYGTINVSYPKTWSLYVDKTNASKPVDAYFHTDYVPSINSKETYNLRMQIATSAYSVKLSQYSGYISTGKIKAEPYSLPKLPSVKGTMLTGQIFPSSPTLSGTIVLLPMRDKTFLIWTESSNYLTDFTTIILPNLTFSP